MPRTKILVLLTLFFVLGCNKEDGEEYTGGKGGSGKILVTPRYNGKFIDNLSIHLNWQDPAKAGDPPPGFDDTSYCVQISGKPVATFDSLKSGRYFMVAEFLDSTQNVIILGNKIVHLQTAESLEITLEMEAH